VLRLHTILRPVIIAVAVKLSYKRIVVRVSKA
jgi:hypothetical protein